MICSTFIAPQQSNGQTWEEAVMDSVLKIFPPDSMYVKNEVIIKFKLNAIDLNKLCYSYSFSENLGNNGKRAEKSFGMGSSLLDSLYSQRFSVEELVLDSSLVARLKMYGGDSLRRITHANPCVDTISITRQGDTIPIYDYLYMMLLVNNDTSVVDLTVWTTIFHQNQIDYVEPNSIVFELDNEPNDLFYSKQKSLKPAHIDAEFAWNYVTGNPSTLVAVIDDGIDYRHCDLGNGHFGNGKKVIYGLNLVDRNTNIYDWAYHGTAVAGIIGAYTNRTTCPTFENGVAGIAGGWKDDNTDNSGCSLIGYQIFPFTHNYESNVEKAMQAVMLACSFSPNSNYGDGVHIINSSFGMSAGNAIYGRNLTKSYEEMLDVAFENGVVQVSSAGNESHRRFRLPSTFDSHKMIRVGAHDYLKKYEPYSNYAHHLDLLAPGGQCLNGNPTPPQNIVYTTTTDNSGASQFECFAKTSAAAPHVTGAVALIHDYALQNGWTLYPEDYEGIIKAAAADVTGSGYFPNYDTLSGWGTLNLKNIFFMFQQGYRIFHYSNEDNNSFTEGDFSPNYRILVSNRGGSKPVGAGEWDVWVRPYTFTITHNPTWFDYGGFKIYVWGRSGPHKGKHGWALKSPPSNDGAQGIDVLFQNGFTGVYSGYGGNYEAQNMIHSSEMANSHEFKFVTYQYKFRNIWGDFIRPFKHNLAMHYTVFAKPLSDTLTGISNEITASKVQINPNVTNQTISITSDLLAETNSTLEVFSSVGVKYHTSKKHISNRVTIDTRDYPIGLYFVTISNGVKSVNSQFIIQK